MMEKSVQELAEFLHGTVENDNPALVVTGAAPGEPAPSTFAGLPA